MCSHYCDDDDWCRDFIRTNYIAEYWLVGASSRIAKSNVAYIWATLAESTFQFAVLVHALSVQRVCSYKVQEP